MREPRRRAFILAGGRSSRFGSDKALALVQGVPLLQHIASTLGEVAADVTVVADRQGKYDALGLRTIADLVPGQGPMSGLHTALLSAGEEASVLIASCDLWGLEAEWLRLLAAAPREASIVLFATNPLQPLLGRYATSLSTEVAAALARGDRAISRFARHCSPLLLPRPLDFDRLVNANTPWDLEVACGSL